MNSPEVLEEMRRRTIQNFMDLLVLAEIKNHPLSGYDVLGLIHRKFDVMVSAGTVYNLLYSLERDGLINGVKNERKRVYSLTPKGEKGIKAIAHTTKKIQNFLNTRI